MSDEVPLTRRAAREAEGGKRPPVEPPTEVLTATGDGEGAEPQPKRSTWGGFTDAVARHPNAWMFASLGVIFLLLGTVSVFTGVAVGSAASPVVVESSTPTPEPSRDVPEEILPATALRTCSIASLAADPRLLTFAGSVINITTGEVLFDRSASVAAPPASGLKVLTAAAALMTLGPDFRMATRVLEGNEPGAIVLVGGGDTTLSRLPPGAESVYPGAPKLADLAAQTLAKWEELHPGEPITKIVLDASYWNPSDKWDPTWVRSELTDGWQAEVTALIVDGDRDDPRAIRSRRSTDPIARAGNAFKDALGLSNPVEVVVGNATPGFQELGVVLSQPMSTLIAQMLDFSDNSLGENIARVVSKEWSGGGSAASLSTIIPGILANLGLDASTIIIRDGSGLSPNNLVPPAFMAQLMAKVATGEQQLGAIKPALPVAGKTGSLRSRFTGSSEVARGNVFAKTGWITVSRTLSGWLNAQDGSVLAFAFYALGPVKLDATVALDAVTTGAFTCGNNLSNN